MKISSLCVYNNERQNNFTASKNKHSLCLLCGVFFPVGSLVRWLGAKWRLFFLFLISRHHLMPILILIISFLIICILLLNTDGNISFEHLKYLPIANNNWERLFALRFVKQSMNLKHSLLSNNLYIQFTFPLTFACDAIHSRFAPRTHRNPILDNCPNTHWWHRKSDACTIQSIHRINFILQLIDVYLIAENRGDNLIVTQQLLCTSTFWRRIDCDDGDWDFHLVYLTNHEQTRGEKNAVHFQSKDLMVLINLESEIAPIEGNNPIKPISKHSIGFRYIGLLFFPLIYCRSTNR